MSALSQSDFYQNLPKECESNERPNARAAYSQLRKAGCDDFVALEIVRNKFETKRNSRTERLLAHPVVSAKNISIAMRILVIIALSAYMIYLQCEIYTRSGISGGFLMALATELVFLFLAFMRMSKFWEFCRIACLCGAFAYAMGMQGIGILEAAETEKAGMAKPSLVEDQLAAAINAKNTGAKYGDHEGIRIQDAEIKRLSSLDIATPIPIKLVEVKSYGLIWFRGFIMFSILLFTHSFRREFLFG